MSKKKKILFIFKKPPYESALFQETLDLLFVCSAFEHEVCVIWAGDGLFSLQKNQAPEKVKIISQLLLTLPMYGIERYFAQESALLDRGLSLADCILNPITPLSDLEMAALIETHDCIFTD